MSGGKWKPERSTQKQIEGAAASKPLLSCFSAHGIWSRRIRGWEHQSYQTREFTTRHSLLGTFLKMPPLSIAQSSSHAKGQKLRLREFHRSLSDDVQERRVDGYANYTHWYCSHKASKYIEHSDKSYTWFIKYITHLAASIEIWRPPGNPEWATLSKRIRTTVWS